MWSIILAYLETLLDETDKFQEIFPYEVEQFNGTPSVTITPSANQNDFSTTASNERTYAFNIRIYVNRDKVGKEDCDRVLRNLVDAVLDHLDRNWRMTGITQPTGYTFLTLLAAPSTWGYSGREDEFRAAQINVQCRVSVDVTQIS